MRTDRLADRRRVLRRPGDRARPRPPASLCESLNRVLDTGAVVMGELIVSVAGVDLLYLNVNVLLSSVETLLAAADGPEGRAQPGPGVLPPAARCADEPREAPCGPTT